MASDFVQIKFFLGGARIFSKKSHNTVNSQTKFLIFCMRPHFLPTYKLSIATWSQKRIIS